MNATTWVILVSIVFAISIFQDIVPSEYDKTEGECSLPRIRQIEIFCLSHSQTKWARSLSWCAMPTFCEVIQTHNTLNMAENQL